MKVLVVVDMQNDFVEGALGTKEACAIVPDVVKMIEGFDGKIVAICAKQGDNVAKGEIIAFVE